MKVLNVHSRIIDQPKSELVGLFDTLATKNDRVFPIEKWPRMKFKEGLSLGAKGGHGPIKYTVAEIQPQQKVVFKFSKPEGFLGHHWFELIDRGADATELKHVIDIKTKGLAIFKWLLVIRPLHDALIEDALDKVENQFSSNKKKTPWSLWVRFLRALLK